MLPESSLIYGKVQSTHKRGKTLESPEADKIAKDKGFDTKASETPACIKCHVLGKDLRSFRVYGNI